MTRTTSTPAKLSPSRLLGDHRGDLRLRFLGTERKGQVLRISANKCTIGSSPTCTLRLICRGVQPLHCMIIRGSAGMAVRRWSLDTRLNDKSFRDAPLLPGDRLSVGPIEFEVLSELPSRAESRLVSQDDFAAHDEVRAVSDADQQVRQAAADLSGLEECMRRHQHDADSLLREVRTLAEKIEEATEQWQVVASQPSDQPHLLAAPIQGLTAKVGALEEGLAQQRAAYDEDRSSWLTQCRQIDAALQQLAQSRGHAADEQSLQDQLDEVDRRFGELLEREQDLSRQQSELAAARVDFERRVDQWEQTREQTQRGLDGARDELTAAQQAWETEQREQQESWQQRTGELEQQAAALQQQRDELTVMAGSQTQEDQHALREERDELARQVEALQGQLQETRQEHGDAEEQWQELHRTLEARMQATLADLEQRHQAQQTLAEELEAARLRLEESQDRERRLEVELNELSTARSHDDDSSGSVVVDDGLDHDVPTSEPRDDAADDFAADRTLTLDVIQQLRAEAAHGDANAEEEDAEEFDFASDASPSSPTIHNEDEITYSAPPETAPVDTAAILAKFGQPVEQPSTSPFQQPEDADAPRDFASDEPGGEVESFGEEHSINEYMAKLMQRVGGGTFGTAQPSSPLPVDDAPAKQKPVEPKQTSIPTERGSETLPLDPSEFLPRAVAPEASSNLKALRDVANSSARTAIDKHQRKNYEQLALVFWCVSIVALMVGGTLIVWAKSVFSVPSYCSMIGFLLSFYSVWRALSYTAKARLGERAAKKADAESPEGGSQAAGKQPVAPTAAVDPLQALLPKTPRVDAPLDADSVVTTDDANEPVVADNS